MAPHRRTSKGASTSAPETHALRPPAAAARSAERTSQAPKSRHTCTLRDFAGLCSASCSRRCLVAAQHAAAAAVAHASGAYDISCASRTAPIY